MSRSPSRSTSTTAMDSAEAGMVTRKRCLKAGGEAPLFSYQEMPETRSRSPSWSISAASADSEPPLGRVRVGQKLGLPVFSYQWTLLSEPETEMTSLSPSPSRSAAHTSTASVSLNVIGIHVQVSPSPAFAYHAISSLLNAAERKSMSASASTRQAKAA